jgi:uncharacterized protein (DUF885 family)
MPGTADELAGELLTTVFDADPLSASLYGVPGYDGRLPDFSAQADADTARRLADVATRADQADENGLDEADLQTLDFVRCLSRNMAEAAEVPLNEFTISDTFVAPVGGLLNVLPKLQLDTAERRDGYVARLRGLPALLETLTQRQIEGREAGRCAVARLVESAITQLDLLLQDPGLAGVAREGEQGGDEPAIGTAVDQQVRPSLAAYRDSLRSDVLPFARDDDHPGICFLPGGSEMYRKLVLLHTSSEHTPAELHAMGRQIVAEVHAEMRQTGGVLFGTTDLAEIFDRLSNDPAFRYKSREEMLEHARRAVTAAEAEAPNWFAVVPEKPCTVEPVPEAEEAGMAPAYYMPGAIDGSRPGTYFLNTSKPEERNRYAAEDIAFHEAVPGHHFQLTIALESTDLAPARRVLHDTACAEGWGLYSERLADEMGLYSDDLSRMGLFVADAWRASRLVVDTGLHEMGWPRQRAVEWMIDNTPLPRIDVEAEIDRYISYPGQALAYMVGRREIVRLRSEVSVRLGDHFDLRRFHDVVLHAGILPLPALARAVDRWVTRTAATPGAT